MTTLVTGGKGFIGARLIRKLADRGDDVVCFDLKATPGRIGEYSRKITMVEGDIVNFASIAETIKTYRIDKIAHMVFFSAEERGVSERPERSDLLYKQQMVMNTGTFHLFEAARLAGIKTVVFPSSIQYHGYDKPWDGEIPIREASPPRPTTAYGIGKHLAEYLAHEYNRLHGMHIVSFRIPAVYGPGVRFGARGVNLIGTDGAQGKPVRLAFPSAQRMVLAHVDDVTEALTRALAAPTPSEVYHVGGHDVSLADLAALGRELIPDLQVTFDEQARLIAALPVDSSLIEREIGLRHRSLREGFSSLIQETRAQGSNAA